MATVLVVIGVMLYLQYKEVDKAMVNFKEVHSQYSDGSEKASTDLSNAFEQLGDLLASNQEKLDAAQTDLTEATANKEGYGEIRGSILPFVTSGSGLTQYQTVCAETKENKDKLYCQTVSSIQKGFVLVVPTGEYYVYAEIVSGEPATKYKAYYTEFVKCNQVETNANCSSKLSDKRVLVKVEDGETVESVDPADWDFIVLGAKTTAPVSESISN